MGFLTPWFLLGLLAVAGPVVAHLRRRSIQKRLAFSAVEFLQPHPPRTARRRWEDLALLAVRCAALALISLAFARPYFPENKVPLRPETATRRVVLLLDTSASMQRGSLFADALQQAASVATALSPQDRFEVRTFDRSVRTVLSSEAWTQTPPASRKALLQNALERLRPSWAQTHLDNALRSVAEDHATHSRNDSTQTFVISDFQEGSTLAGLQGFAWPSHFQVVPVFLKPPATSPLTLHWLPPNPDTDSTETPLKVLVHTPPDFEAETASLLVETTPPIPPSPRSVALSRGKSQIVTLPAPNAGAARIHLAQSSEFNASVWTAPLPQTRTLVATASSENADDPRTAMYFVQRALRALGDKRVEIVHAPALPADASAPVGLWFLAGTVDPALLLRIRASIAGGATSLLTLHSEADAATLQLLTEAPFQIQEREEKGGIALGSIDRTHPLFSAFGSPQFSDFTGIRFWKFRHVNLPPDSPSRVLARLEGGSPAVLEMPVGKGRIIVWTSAWKPEDSQWVLSSRCVPFLAACVDLAGGEHRTFTVGTPGDALAVPEGTLGVRSTDGRLFAAEGRHVTLEEPGAYRIEPAGGMVVVNVAPDESRLSPMAPGTLEALGVPCAPSEASAPAGGPAPIAAAEPQSLSALEARQGTWRWLLVGVLGLLVLETLWSYRITLRKGGVA